MPISYRVVPKTTYAIKRYDPDAKQGHQSRMVGETYQTYQQAYDVAYALAKEEQHRLGVTPGGEGVQFPERDHAASSGYSGHDLMVVPGKYAGMSYEQASQEAHRLLNKFSHPTGWHHILDDLFILRKIMLRHTLGHLLRD